MKEIVLVTCLTLVLLTFPSCDPPEVDLSAPSMEIISFNPVPGEDEICGTQEPTVFQLTGGDDLNFDVIFQDDIALSQYKIDIHNNFDCHGHGGGIAPSVAVPSVDNLTKDWSILEIVNITGEEAPVNRILEVPENVTAGNYHFQIQVIDETGNDNPGANIYALKIKNPVDDVPPVISISEPAVNNFTIKKGETVNFKGQVSDDRSLSDGGNGILFLSYTDLSSGNTFATDQVFAFDETTDNNYDFDFTYTIPQTLITGDYLLSLGANDGVRNVAEFMFFEVNITN